MQRELTETLGALGPSTRSRSDSAIGQFYSPMNALTVAVTLAISLRPSFPALRKIREGSTVAILVGRTTQGEGRPARAGSAIGASWGNALWRALVIIANQTNPCAASCALETTSAGRRFSANRSE
jgi:hypothetical protein